DRDWSSDVCSSDLRDAQHLHLPSIGRGEALENLDGGGLAGAVRPEQAEAFAQLHGEIQAGHGDHVAVTLDEPRAADPEHPQARLSPARLGSGVDAILRAWSSCMTRLFTPSVRPRIFMLMPPPRPAITDIAPATSA